MEDLWAALHLLHISRRSLGTVSSSSISQRRLANEVGQRPEFLVAEAPTAWTISDSNLLSVPLLSTPLVMYLQPPLPQMVGLLLVWLGFAGRHLLILFSIFRWQEKKDAQLDCTSAGDMSTDYLYELFYQFYIHPFGMLSGFRFVILTCLAKRLDHDAQLPADGAYLN